MPGLPTRVALSMLRVAAIIAIILTLFGVTVAIMRKARMASDERTTLNNLKECAKGVHLAHDHRNKFPPYYGLYGPCKEPLTFHAHLLPYVDCVAIYQAITGEYPLGYDVTKVQVGVYMSTMDASAEPADRSPICNFPINLRLYYTQGGLGTLSTGADLIYPNMPDTFKQDSTSNTLLFATKYRSCGKIGGSMWMDPGNNAIGSPMAATFGASMQLWQAAPTQVQCDPTVGTAVSFTPTSIQIAMCDASVRSVGRGISQATWQAAHTPNAGDTLGTDWEN